MAKLIEKIYGDALFELSIEKNKSKELYLEVSELIKILNENSELIRLLNHPKIGKDEKITIINNIFKNKISEDILSFIVIILKKDRQKKLLKIFNNFIEQVKEYEKIGTAYVTTAIKLNEIQKSELMEKLLKTTEYKKFDIEYFVDESILGGMVIRIRDRVIDSSVKTALSNMSKSLYKLEV
jgi:F-type H+-transporting ATPase subunit delta